MFKKLLTLGLLVLASCGSYDSGDAELDVDTAPIAPSAKLLAAHVKHGTDIVAIEDIDENFIINVNYEFDNVTVYFKPEYPRATITFNGEDLVVGEESSIINLTPNDNTYEVKVTAGVVSKTYNMTIHRGAKNADLDDIVLSEGDLDPTFNTNTILYSVDAVSNSVNVDLSLSDTNASVEWTLYDPSDSVVSTGIIDSFSASLEEGNNKLEIIVTSSDTTVTKTYTINITKLKATGLTDITVIGYDLSPSFDSERAIYTLVVPAIDASITVSAAKVDNLATLTINGSTVASGQNEFINLSYGNNEINFNITKAGEDSSAYKLIVVRGDSLANLENLELTRGSMNTSFNSNTYWYAVEVAYTNNSIRLTPTAESNEATITINGSEVVSSGTQSSSIALSAGLNEITISVESSDTTTTKEYHLSVVRGSDEIDLSSLAISEGSLSPSFSPEKITYTVQVEDVVSSLRLTPITEDEDASITVNGTTVISGDESQAIAIASGTTEITVIITSSDTQNTKTYKVFVNKP